MNNKGKIDLPKDVEMIINSIYSAGFEAFAVGGCVRDSILGKEPSDWDITTSAHPGDVKNIFPKTFDTGLKHGTVTVVENGINYEITTYRIEGDYTDSRRPDSVEYTDSLEVDLSRRDFTINAMAYNATKGLVDPFGGIRDIELRRIRTVGNPDDRFAEDALRMLRAVRFSAQLGYEIHKDTAEGCIKNADRIQQISGERVRVELEKTILSQNPSQIRILHDLGLMKFIMPELDICFSTEQHHPYHIYNVGDHTLKTLENIRSNSILRWAMLLHDVGKAVTKSTDTKGIDHFYGHNAVSEELSRSIMNRLRFDNKTKTNVCLLIKNHDRMISPGGKSLKRAISELGKENMELLFEVKRADKFGQNPDFLEKSLMDLEELISAYNKIINTEECFDMKNLAVDGNDLISIGIIDGKQIGKILKDLFDMVLEKPEMNTKEELIKISKELIQ